MFYICQGGEIIASGRCDSGYIFVDDKCIEGDFNSCDTQTTQTSPTTEPSTPSTTTTTSATSTTTLRSFSPCEGISQG
jgi:hypothetical protein